MISHLNLAEVVSLGLYRATTSLIAPFLGQHLKKRVKRGKEHPQRWHEKQGIAGAERPSGTLIWLNAVGLGEVMALRGLIIALHNRDPELQFLVTSSTLISATTFANNLPPNTLHQFLPLDCPAYTRQFLDHWHPDLALWSEQDIWPSAVHETALRHIPQALINVRMSAASFRSKTFVRPLFRATYKSFSLISAQERVTAQSLQMLAGHDNIRIDGSLKPHCPPLFIDRDKRTEFTDASMGRSIWLAASCHPEDEDIALAAQRLLLRQGGHPLLIISPRYPNRANEILAKLDGFNVKVRSRGELPNAQTQIYLADTFAEMGLWYASAQQALIGGTFSAIEGHNPWEALQLGCGVLHGPRVANFASDFGDLGQASACVEVGNPEDIAAHIAAASSRGLERFERLQQANKSNLSALIDLLLGLIRA